ncbi:hypothetical protein TNCV_5082031 [Trichonephila clavipes]|nr:hypothetical protein TNCV_5082031 [Trichonephila clavipes]
MSYYSGSFGVREKCINRLVPGLDYMVDVLKLLNQAPRVSAVSGQSLALSGPVIDSRDLNLVFGYEEATPIERFLSTPPKCTVEPSWPLVLVLENATTTNMPVNFDYFCDFIDVLTTGLPVQGASLTSKMPEQN